MLRIMKALLIFSVAAWGFVGVQGNFEDFGGTLGALEATTSMATVPDMQDHWKATTNPIVIWLGALFIIGGKITTGALCALGAANMWQARKSDAAAFNASKKLGLAGCAVAFFMLFTGWIIIAESWFYLWNSDALRDVSLGAAHRYAMFIGIIAVFVGLADE
ncbi:MAG: DUF2165 family protein [Marinicaulis sp.]|nr:DUF2165 family protein [Marinicaulis sp.]